MKAVTSRQLSDVLSSEKADCKTYRVVALRGTHRRTKRVSSVESAKKEN